MEGQKVNFLKTAMPFMPAKYFTRRPEPLVRTRIPYAIGYVPEPEPEMPEPEVPVFITADALKYICPRLPEQRTEILSGVFNKVLTLYPELQNPTVLRELIAQAATESAEFREKSENMYYTSADRLRAVFPSYIKTKEQAEWYLRKPEDLGDLVYSNRNGNGPNDGYRFRGGTFIMLTFRPTWEGWAAWNGLPVDTALDLGRTDDRYAFDAACWFFAIKASLVDLAKQEQLEKITRRITGSLIGIGDRITYRNRAKMVI